ncbi:MAG: hypothetical protein ACXWUG_19625 [Polyangiales bacterium]
MMTTVGFLAGFVSGWAVRSSVDTPNSLAIKTLGLVYRTKARLVRWAAVEREQIADLVAEVQSRYEGPAQPKAVSKSGDSGGEVP